MPILYMHIGGGSRAVVLANFTGLGKNAAEKQCLGRCSQVDRVLDVFDFEWSLKALLVLLCLGVLTAVQWSFGRLGHDMVLCLCGPADAFWGIFYHDSVLGVQEFHQLMQVF